MVEIKLLRASRPATHASDATVAEAINEGRFTHIRPADDRDFRGVRFSNISKLWRAKGEFRVLDM
jgi:hypothetical protein